MNCREFEKHLADWISGRLPEERAASLQAHCADCPACARAAEAERDLWTRWRALAALPDATDLWPRIAARIHAAAPAPRFAFVRRLAFTAGVAVAGALCVLFWAHTLSGHPPLTGVRPPNDVVDEGRVVHLVAAMQRLPDPDNDSASEEPRLHYQTERNLLIGERGR